MVAIITHILVAIITLVLGFFGGVVVFKYKIFPYKLIQSIIIKYFDNAKLNGPYSIGIYEGNSILRLYEPYYVTNPVLSAYDVKDIKASFVADPFLIRANDKYYMFFEVINRYSGKGEIAYAVSEDLREWEYKKVVLKEDFHLSYPYVFEWQGRYYMIPESLEDLSVRLYVAKNFPEGFELVCNILTGYRFVDPSIFRYRNKWWMFVGALESDTLNLYYSNDLETGWVPHPKNPIIKKDRRFGRPAGRVIFDEGRPIRFCQDCLKGYGSKVYAFEINDLSEERYEERLLSDEPIVCGSGKGWNRKGMHHVDLLRLGEKWVAAVDGRKR